LGTQLIDERSGFMTDTNNSTGIDLIKENEALRKRVAELETLESVNKQHLQDLAEKEAFNFALFQFNPIFTVVVDKDGRVIKSNYAKRASGDRIPEIGNIMYKDYASNHEINMYEELMDAIRSNQIKHFNELRYKNKYLSITIAPFSKGAIITSQDITERKIAENDRTHLINELQNALNEVETLRGLLPICAGCKKIRDDQGYWNHIEIYLSKHSHLDFTHTLCPECVKHFYPEYYEQMQLLKSRSSQQESQKDN
jgi:hypothetical protein